ncbi:bcl-2-interacting killer isoform X1 [Mus caroli]|uniref:Bcl-2-interacting killer isoform X1 n=2 Tax=Mus caroli TaxID=10089 RepID=A0A6P7QK14_MUSCR|nr:bcl-2-interacting killer isoform X1 [Mus caroli]
MQQRRQAHRTCLLMPRRGSWARRGPSQGALRLSKHVSSPRCPCLLKVHEHMSEARLMARDVIKTVPHDQVPQPPVASEAPSMKEPVAGENLSPVRDVDLMECVEGRNQVALRLACIGDEMDLCLRSPRLVQLPGIAMQR